MQLEAVTDPSCNCTHCDASRRARKLIADYTEVVVERVRRQEAAVMTEYDVYRLHADARREVGEFSLRVGQAFARYLVGCCSVVYRVIAEAKE